MIPILGIDVQARYFTACLLDDSVSVWQYRPANANHLQAVRLAHRTLAAAVGITYPKGGVCWIEEPMGKWQKVISTQNRMIGALITALPPTWSIELVSATEWKRLLNLPGNASKEMSIATAKLAIPDAKLIRDEHHADAVNIAYACRAFAEPLMRRELHA